MKKVWEMTETVLRHVLGTKIVLIFAVIALSLILLQAGSVSSAEEPIIYKGHTIRPDGSGNFEVAGKGGFNYSQFSHKAWDYAYMNVSNYIGVNKEVTLSSDAYVGSLERFNTTSQTWNVTNISIFNNGSLITRGITFNLLNAQNNQFRVLISNTAKDDGTYSWFLNTSILGTMYVLEFDPISEGVNVAGQSKGSTPAFVSPSTWTLTPNNINDENFVNNAQTGDSGFSTIRFVINLSQPQAVNKSNMVYATSGYLAQDYNISGNGNATGKFSDVELGNMTWTLLKVVIGNANVNDTQDFVNNQSYNRYMIAVSKYLHNGDNNGWAPNEVSLYNTSNLTSGGGSSANESQGDTAIEAGINSSIPTATKYKEQQVYVRNLSNNQTLGTFDWVAAFGSQRWVLNYITAGESYVRAPNLTTAVYVLEIADKTTLQITDEVSKLINATKS